MTILWSLTSLHSSRMTGAVTYPSQGLLYSYHLLLHHHHQLDAFFITHCDLTGYKAKVISCRQDSEEVKDLMEEHGDLTAIRTYNKTSAAPFDVCRITPFCGLRKFCQKDLFFFRSHFPMLAKEMTEEQARPIDHKLLQHTPTFKQAKTLT